MSNLPQDIIINILSRLPAKSLGQLKSVCKSWHSLISRPHFIKLHHKRAISDPNVNHSRLFLRMNRVSSQSQFTSIDYESPSIYQDAADNGEAIVELGNPLGENREKLVGSCCGLIYFVCYQACIVLWNPCIKQTRQLPNPPRSFYDPWSSFTDPWSSFPDPMPFYGLCFDSFTDPSSSFPAPMFFYGLGFDSSIDDYKMVRAVCSASAKKTKVEVFNLRSDSWRMIQPLNYDIHISQEVGTFTNGALHWQASRDVGSKKYYCIVSLDLRMETFGEILQPDPGDKSASFYNLGNLKGCLSLFLGGYESDVEIWIMKEYGVTASWTRLIILPWVGFIVDYTLSPVCFTKNGDLIVALDDWHLVRVNVREETWRKFNMCYNEFFEWFIYVESLVSPHG